MLVIAILYFSLYNNSYHTEKIMINNLKKWNNEQNSIILKQKGGKKKIYISYI